MLPTLALIKKEKTVDYVVGLDELGGADSFETVRTPHAAPAPVRPAGQATGIRFRAPRAAVVPTRVAQLPPVALRPSRLTLHVSAPLVVPQETLRDRLAAAGVVNFDGEAARARSGKAQGKPSAVRQSTLNDAAHDESSDFDD